MLFYGVLRDEELIEAESGRGLHCEYHAFCNQQYEPATHSPKLPVSLAHCPHNGIIAGFESILRKFLKLF